MRLATPTLAATFAVTGVLALACGGLPSLSGAAVQSTTATVLELDSGDHTALVTAALDECWLEADAGRFDFEAAMALDEKVDAALADGDIDEGERDSIVADCGTSTVSGGDRTAKLSAHRESLKTHQSSSASNFGRWETPTEMEQRLRAHGWDVQMCEVDEQDDTNCEAKKGDEFLWVMHFDYLVTADARAKGEEDLNPGEVFKRDGSVVLSLRVIDLPATAKLRDALFPDGTAIADFSEKGLRAHMGTTAGEIFMCETGGDGDDWKCYAKDGDHLSRVAIYLEEDPGEPGGWSNDDGTACNITTTGYACIRTYSMPRGKAEIEALTTAR